MKNIDHMSHVISGYPNYETRGGLIYRRGKSEPRKSSTNPCGYEVITLFEGGRRKSHSVSNLICEAVYGPRPSVNHHCCHNDGDRSNNIPSNLRWATAVENNADKVQHGTWQGGEANGRAIVSEEDVLLIRSDERPYKVIAEQYGIAKVTVSAIRRRLIWSHVV